ncbi:MAG: hypothetical protein V3V68_05065 [Nitrosomonadaceae bacterium]
MTIQELFTQIGQYDYRAQVAMTFEGVIYPIEVYPAADGTILIAFEGDSSKMEHQKIKCAKCGKQA